MPQSKAKRIGRPKRGKRVATHPYIAKHPDCPRSFHPGSKQFCKVHRGKRYYFGPEPVEAIRRYEREWSYIVRGEAIPDGDGRDVGWLVNLWLDDRRQDVEAGRLKESTWEQYREVGTLIIAKAGRGTAVSGMTPARSLRPTPGHREAARPVSGGYAACDDNRPDAVAVGLRVGPD